MAALGAKQADDVWSYLKESRLGSTEIFFKNMNII